MLRPLVLPGPRPCAHAKKKIPPIPIFSDVYAIKKSNFSGKKRQIFPLLKDQKAFVRLIFEGGR